MNKTLAAKILDAHLVSGRLVAGEEIGIRIDQTLTQDSTGTMAYLQLEAMEIPRVKTKLSVAFVDHNTLQSGFENADDHLYIQTVAAKHGIVFSKPGNGICHQVQLERFSHPGWTLLGSDSHTPTGGGIGMLAIGAGGLDVAVAMAGGAYYLTMPKICQVELTGKLPAWAAAKDIILEVLRRLTVKGGVGRIFEYTGDGLAGLTVPERATITNMGAELGATTSLFPSDATTQAFLSALGRGADWLPLTADADAVYDETVTIRLDELEPLVALPHSPDNVVPVASVAGSKVDQVAIGSCTNSSYLDLSKVAKILAGKRVHPEVSLVIAPGSRQVLGMLADSGALSSLLRSGARILECACGPCIGMGQAPKSGGVSLRTFNRNFAGRSGTPDAKVYLCSPEVAAVSALTGKLSDPRDYGHPPVIDLNTPFVGDDNLLVFPPEQGQTVEVVRGPNIKPFPVAKQPPVTLTGAVLLKVGDNITTDHIMPSHAHLLPYRSNIPHLAKYCFSGVDADFPARALAQGGGLIVAGANYGQGSSREHAALAPLYLGVKGVIAQSFARIHRANLINFGILPLIFANPGDYDKLAQSDVLTIDALHTQVQKGELITAANTASGQEIPLRLVATSREKEIILAGGLLNFTRQTGGFRFS
ncbi:MAG TPA: aconitate hydratase [Methylomusa anaerophila]|uniref:Homoaconitase large subunit n=1 Tax=Methylomusa anaerophila TaxID=1930071 RepID=A0A348ALL1_9FIRM|nr:aconitate hydratase [Methylomusa anaerophila]BBB91959.1 homoaconitase large subunit [Methylomusa anaerophila]HML88029.1 aconitate hydratase [Methylomusa anaerophila]